MSGLSLNAARQCLLDQLPSGTDVYVALMLEEPDFQGGSGIEVSAAWYARQAHQDWNFATFANGLVIRANKGAIVFPVVAGEEVEVEAWAIYDAAVGGSLIAFGPTRTSGLTRQPYTIPIGDEARFNDSDLRIGLSPDVDLSVLSGIFQEEQPMQTIGAVTDEVDIVTLDDGDAVKIELEVTGRRDDGLEHYSRRVVKKFYRDDGGAGTTLWNVDELQADGVATRIGGLVTATADLVRVGNTIRARVTGEAGKTIDWKAFSTTLEN